MGSLCVSAQVNNAAIYVSSGSTLHQNGGTLSIFKTDKLGFAAVRSMQTAAPMN